MWHSRGVSETNPWKARWRDGNFPWHRDHVHPDLHAFGGTFLGERARRVFVPLCGKSVDLRWLADQGHDVVGVELSELAVEAMCEEQSIDPERDIDGPFTVYRAERLTVYCGDYFELTPAQVGAERVWDKASMIALPPDLRGRYVAHLRTLVAADSAIMLNAIDYDQSVMDGPPFSVTAAEVRERYTGCTVDVLSESDGLDDSPRWREAGHERFVRATYLITM